MVQDSKRTGITGSALVRLLSRLNALDVRESRQGFADRLSEWLGWTDAIALSTALNSPPASTPAGTRASLDGGDEGQGERVRTSLAAGIAEDVYAARQEASTDFPPYRRRYVARQQAMEKSIGTLRERLRATLATRPGEMARLAAVDAVMEQALVGHELRLLSTIPAQLEKHFKRLRQAHQPAPDAPEDAVQSSIWLDVFCKDMQSVLLAELDIRFQPIEGLTEALRKSSSG